MLLTTNLLFNVSTVAASVGALGISTGAALIAVTTNATSIGQMRNTTVIDKALSSVNDRRARLGAFQNRLESALNTSI